MKKTILLVTLVALVALIALAVATPPAGRDLLRVGPFTSWKSAPDGDPSRSLLRATAETTQTIGGGDE